MAQIMEGPPINDTAVKSLWEEKWNELVWGNQYELDRAEQEAFQKLQADLEFLLEPIPIELRLTKVDGIHFCWDELCEEEAIRPQSE